MHSLLIYNTTPYLKMEEFFEHLFCFLGSFYGNKKLKKLVISGKKLRTVGTKAFSSGQSGKIIVKAVKGKQKKYCRLLRKAGMKSKIRVS